jgi:hypothetical protein
MVQYIEEENISNEIIDININFVINNNENIFEEQREYDDELPELIEDFPEYDHELINHDYTTSNLSFIESYPYTEPFNNLFYFDYQINSE